jgi:hypothetical protein
VLQVVVVVVVAVVCHHHNCVLFFLALKSVSSVRLVKYATLSFLVLEKT